MRTDRILHQTWRVSISRKTEGLKSKIGTGLKRQDYENVAATSFGKVFVYSIDIKINLRKQKILYRKP